MYPQYSTEKDSWEGFARHFFLCYERCNSMNIKIFSFCFVILFFFVFDFDNTLVFATTETIVIDEVQTTGGAGHSNDEFIRLINTTDTIFDLTGFKLTKKYLSGETCKESTLVSTGHFTGLIAPGATFTIAHPSYKEIIHADLEYSGASYYISDNTVVTLYDALGNPLDQKAVGADCTTIISDPPDDASLPPTPSIVTVTYSTAVRLNELLANPSGKEEEMELIELYNPTDTAVNISLWSLRDGSASGKYIFPEGTALPAQGFLVMYRPTFKLALNNSNETVSLLDPNGETRDTVFYKTAKEDVSYNYTSTGWRGGTPTPGMTNRTNSLPETREKVPKKGYRGVALDFDARGRDTEHDHLKYTWNFGDGHKSYKETTTHKYEENGTYIVTLKTSDGKDDVEETFTIEIKSYPHPEVRIVALLPNPAGNDTGNEWLLIENREKKTINLKGYSIATGWKSLVNHPLREDFFIKPKKQAFLRNPTSLFTLPNQKGKIELRAPDGKVLQDIKYKLDKSIADDVVYRKEKGSKWKWDASSVHIPALSPSKEPDETSETKKDSPLLEEPTTVQETIIPLMEETPQTKIMEEKETVSPLISLDPDRPLPQDILTYGTALETPRSLILAVPADEKIAVSSPADSSEISPEETSLFIEINTALNDFLNTKD